MGIAWIASYPKSGNTWVRFLVHHLRFGPAASSAELNRNIPPVLKHPDFPVPAGETVCSKTHFVWSPKHPRFAETDRAIHIIRNPRDVALSALNYRRMAGVLPPRISDAQYVRAFIAHSGDPEWKRTGFGTWTGNVASWTAPLPFPVLILRYENLKADPIREARSIASFLGLAPTDDDLARAVESCRFESLRKLESSERAKGEPDTIFRSATKDRFFMNKGLTGQRLDDIAPGLDAAFDSAFATPLRQLGYAGG